MISYSLALKDSLTAVNRCSRRQNRNQHAEMRRAAALLSTIGLTPAACAAADKQPIFRSNGAQSLSAWQISGKVPSQRV